MGFHLTKHGGQCEPCLLTRVANSPLDDHGLKVFVGVCMECEEREEAVVYVVAGHTNDEAATATMRVATLASSVVVVLSTVQPYPYLLWYFILLDPTAEYSRIEISDKSQLTSALSRTYFFRCKVHVGMPTSFFRKCCVVKSNSAY